MFTDGWLKETIEKGAQLAENRWSDEQLGHMVGRYNVTISATEDLSCLNRVSEELVTEKFEFLNKYSEDLRTLRYMAEWGFGVGKLAKILIKVINDLMAINMRV